MIMQRIVVLGNAGSGKSTLARRLAATLDLPIIHMDVLFWEPGWREPEPKSFRDKLAASVAGERWVSEGNYARRSFDLRLSRATAVIWLDTPRLLCAARVARRSAFHRSRSDLPNGCYEKFNLEFLRFIRYAWTFDRDVRPRIEDELQKFGASVPIYHFRHQEQITAFIAQCLAPQFPQPQKPLTCLSPEGGRGVLAGRRTG
jgi:adenylate kinase family enzyme